MRGVSCGLVLILRRCRCLGWHVAGHAHTLFARLGRQMPRVFVPPASPILGACRHRHCPPGQ